MDETEAALVAGCRRRDERAFRQLVERYQQPVYSLCVALAAADADDLAQETFLRIFKAIAEFDPRGPATLRSWILVIARRLCHDRARHVRRGIELAIEPPADAADPAAGPEDRLHAAHMGARLRAAIARLPEEQRLVLALREWEGLEYEEIAAIDDVPVGTVRSRLARARAALKQAFGADADGEAVRSTRDVPV
jgi:RNA polymerase sigma-70 factor (ECF subfamily)